MRWIRVRQEERTSAAGETGEFADRRNRSPECFGYSGRVIAEGSSQLIRGGFVG
ncbi:hypothetical protein KCH_34280 [Kitasatospora cheerisanensis KCTC 2395]|uniref:Uncharacterized protein n=1 Tax=Kitasatospora cheerisanensis KCTC 2395 TaxID=1348663 RepID=A0A066Z3G2_9ACTN|nr:hypothetical protein KCH_34280 [Kitasatospora cheerisanensis KCTC 2395]